MMQVTKIRVEWANGEWIEYSTTGLLYDFKTCKRIFKTLLTNIKRTEKQ